MPSLIVLLLLVSTLTSCEFAGTADQAAISEEVSLEVAPAPQVNLGEVLVHFDEITDSLALGSVQTHLHNASDLSRHLYLEYSFTDSRGNTQHFKTQQQELEAGQRLSKTKVIEVRNPTTWTPEDPQNYQISVRVFADGTEVGSREIHGSLQDVENTDTAFNQHGAHPGRGCMPVRNSIIR